MNFDSRQALEGVGTKLRLESKVFSRESHLGSAGGILLSYLLTRLECALNRLGALSSSFLHLPLLVEGYLVHSGVVGSDGCLQWGSRVISHLGAVLDGYVAAVAARLWLGKRIVVDSFGLFVKQGQLILRQVQDLAVLAGGIRVMFVSGCSCSFFAEGLEGGIGGAQE